jgi:glycosyltransferase involved in cell wall biosynthesis
MLNALRAVSEVDVVILGEATAPVVAMPPPTDLSVHYLYHGRSPTRPNIVRWLATGTAPSGLLRYDTRRLCADLDALLTRSRYDVFWSSTLAPLLILGGKPAHRVILDLYDLEDQKLRQTLPSIRDVVRSRRPRAAFHRALTKRNASRWASQQTRLAHTADVVLVCSDADRARLSAPRTLVVPNGAHDPGTTRDHRAVRPDEPVITLHGSLRYGPNLEAAEILVGEIAPRIRQTIADVRLRLVGEAPPSVHALHAPPAVTVTGYVPDITSELRRSDLVAVPLRSGSGTRVKIIEAFAHGVPVVGSSVAVDGLDVRDGVHLLIRDDRDEFAAACVDLLTRLDLRIACIENAMALYQAKYRWSTIEHDVRRLIQEIGGA